MRFLRPIGLYLSRIAPEIRRRRRPLIGVGAGLLATVVIVQLAYPSSQALPGTYLNGEAVRGETYTELSDRILTGFENSNVAITVGDASKNVTLSDLGASPQIDAMTRDLLHYPLWQRLVPFSFLVRPVQVDDLKLAFSDSQLEVATMMLSEELSVPAEDAKLAIADGELTTTAAKNGQKVEAKTISEMLLGDSFGFGTTSIAIPGEPEQPAIVDADITPLRAQAEEIIQRQIAIVAENGTESVPGPSDITSWLTVVTSETGKPELAVTNESLAAYIGTLNKVVGIAPGTIKATMVDGEETGRTDAPSGLAIAESELADGIKRALFDSTAPMRLAIRMAVVPPNVSYERSYTSSQKGLQAYVDYVTSSEDVRISLSQVGGRGWSASGRADEQIVAASTYKLYVSYMLFKEIGEGKVRWDTEMLGTDVAGCFERMIVLSDNPCAEEFIRMFDAFKINAYLYSKDISKTTTFISREAAQTSAADLEKMVRGIEDSGRIGGGDRSRLLDAMGRQRHRAGIPAGSQGVVYNKVGFLWEYLNDAAIVRHPKGTYTIAILTKGASWNKIAEITRQIEQIMYS